MTSASPASGVTSGRADARDFVHVETMPRSEPPVVGARTAVPTPSPSTIPSARRGAVSVPRGAISARRRGPHSGRSGSERRSAVPTAADTRHCAAARRFADRAVRLTLEVIDRRRPVGSLGSLVTPAVVGMVSALSSTDVPGRSLGSAVVRTVHVRAAGDGYTGEGWTGDGWIGEVEVFGTYSRGQRVFAVAARLSSRRTPAGPTWVMSSLRLS